MPSREVDLLAELGDADCQCWDAEPDPETVHRCPLHAAGLIASLTADKNLLTGQLNASRSEVDRLTAERGERRALTECGCGHDPDQHETTTTCVAWTSDPRDDELGEQCHCETGPVKGSQCGPDALDALEGRLSWALGERDTARDGKDAMRQRVLALAAEADGWSAPWAGRVAAEIRAAVDGPTEEPDPPCTCPSSEACVPCGLPSMPDAVTTEEADR